VAGGIVALVLSEGLRKKVLDALFGAEEEFEVTRRTTSPTTRAALRPALRPERHLSVFARCNEGINGKAPCGAPVPFLGLRRAGAGVAYRCGRLLVPT